MRLSLLQKRGEIYHFRWSIPLDLRPILKRRELTKSLNTSSRISALAAASELYSLVERTKQARRLYQLGKLSKERLQFHIQQIWSNVGEALLSPPSEKSIGQARSDNQTLHQILRTLSVQPKASVPSTHLRKRLELDEEKVVSVRFKKGATERRYKRVLGDALESAGVEFDEKDLMVLVEQLMQAQAYYAQRLDNFLDVDKPIEPPKFVTPKIFETESGSLLEAPIFSEFYEYWLNDKKNDGLSAKLQQSYQRFYTDWSSTMPDQPLNQYRKKDIRDFILMLSSLPKRNLKKYKGKPLSELLENEFPDEDKVAPKTALEAKKWLQGIFSRAFDEEILSSSPAMNLNLDLEISKPYGSYSDEQVSRMLNRVCSEQSWRKWVIWLAAYTGMRRGEIAQLHRSDIRWDSKSERYFILVTDESEGQSLKSEAAKRKVPIHKQLEQIGFIEFVEGSEDRIFPGLNPQSITSWFGSVLKSELDIPQFSEYGQRLVFHSFRHTVITKSLSANEVALVQEVVGHEKQQMGVTSRYNHNRELISLLPAIDCIDYGQ